MHWQLGRALQLQELIFSCPNRYKGRGRKKGQLYYSLLLSGLVEVSGRAKEDFQGHGDNKKQTNNFSWLYYF